MKAAARAAAHEAFRLARAGRVDEALPFAERAVDGAQECLPAHGFLASLLLKLGRPHEAERIVAQAVELAPGGADAYDGLANVSMALGQHDRANAYISVPPNLRRTILGFGTTWHVASAASAS